VIEEEDLVGYSRLDFDFHGFIYNSCNNKVLQEMLENIKNKSRPIAMLITPIRRGCTMIMLRSMRP